MALPDAWLDLVLGKLAVRYGEAWFRKWDAIPVPAMRADWAEVLDGLQAHDGAALRYGLEHLPDDFPPTATAFKALCNRRPDPQQPRIEHKMPVNHEAVAKIREKVGEFAVAADVRAKERAAREAAANPRRTVVVPPDLQRLRPPQGPLPWPRGVPRPDGAEA